MDEDDVALRNLTYQQFVELGQAPTVHHIAAISGATADDVWSGWQRLHDEHALVLQSHAREIRMANPFSAVYRWISHGIQAGPAPIHLCRGSMPRRIEDLPNISPGT
jgi:hypothetical protein